MAGKLVIGNWKMNARTDSARALLQALLTDGASNRDSVGVAAPTAYLADLAEQLRGQNLRLCAQDVSVFDQDGAFTGENSAAMLADIGCSYTLVGHSERRQYFAESNSVLVKKMRNAIAAGLVPVLCVGETLDQRENGRQLEVILDQLSLLSQVEYGGYVVAYEPVWAIGTAKVPALAQIAEMHGAIKKWCLQNARASDNIRVLYGGSVKADNAEAILAIKSVDGVLVGSASLDAASFNVICRLAQKMIEYGTS